MDCEYCDDVHSSTLFENASLRIGIDGYRGGLHLNYYDQMWDYAFVEANYCLKCGRDLRGDD